MDMFVCMDSREGDDGGGIPGATAWRKLASTTPRPDATLSALMFHLYIILSRLDAMKPAATNSSVACQPISVAKAVACDVLFVTDSLPFGIQRVACPLIVYLICLSVDLLRYTARPPSLEDRNRSQHKLRVLCSIA